MAVYKWSHMTPDEVHKFKASWPCHGLDAVEAASFEFAPNGDLSDIELTAFDGSYLDPSELDSPALLALSRDAKAKIDAGS